MEIDVLGTKYELITASGQNRTDMDGADGLCYPYSKQIIIRDVNEMLEGEKEEAKVVRFEEVKRHELVHAFFHESGLSDYESDEVLVNWIAMQAEKLVKAFKEAEKV